jgi:hypothetical protein
VIIELTAMEIGAVANFLAAPGPLKSALEKIVEHLASEHKAMCAAALSTVPRNLEIAVDHAAKAQLCDEFWPHVQDLLNEAGAVQQFVQTLEEVRSEEDPSAP